MGKHDGQQGVHMMDWFIPGRLSGISPSKTVTLDYVPWISRFSICQWEKTWEIMRIKIGTGIEMDRIQSMDFAQDSSTCFPENLGDWMGSWGLRLKFWIYGKGHHTFGEICILILLHYQTYGTFTWNILEPKKICTAWTPVTVPSFDPIAEVEEATTVACRALEVDHSWKGELRAHLTLGIWQWMAMGIFAQIEETIEYEAQM